MVITLQYLIRQSNLYISIIEFHIIFHQKEIVINMQDERYNMFHRNSITSLRRLLFIRLRSVHVVKVVSPKSITCLAPMNAAFNEQSLLCQSQLYMSRSLTRLSLPVIHISWNRPLGIYNLFLQRCAVKIEPVLYIWEIYHTMQDNICSHL